MSLLEPDWEFPRSYVCFRAPSPPPIEGRLVEAWEAAPWTEDFVDISTDVAPRFRTRAKMLWDDGFFYVGAEMEEPHVWGTLTEHDSVIFQDNDFEVFIDPDSDNHQYYEFEINALNTTWDLRLVKPYRDGGPALNEWEIPGMRHAVHVNGTLNDPRDKDGGWSVTLAFPWNVLGEFSKVPSPPRHGDQWRVNFSRVEWQVSVENDKYVKLPGLPEDNWVWSPQGVIDMHRPERWGYVQFSGAEAGSASARKEAFLADGSYSGRVLLHRVYYAQKRYFGEHGDWSNSLRQLGFEPSDGLVLRRTAEGYIASLNGLSIREDSLVITSEHDS